MSVCVECLSAFPDTARWNPLCVPCGEAHLDEVIAQEGLEYAQ